MQTLYDVLGVPISASPAEVQNAYRKLLLRVHPDRCYHDNDSAIYNTSADVDEARLRVLEKAHAILSDPEKRRRYDDYLAGKLPNRALTQQMALLQQWDALPTDDVLSSMMELLSTALAPWSSPAADPSSNLSPEQATSPPQQQQQTAPAAPAKDAATSAAANVPMVYTAAVHMQRQPDGTMSVRSYESGPRPINDASPAAATSKKAGELPRRVKVIEEQLAHGGTAVTGEGAKDEFAETVNALTNTVVSLVAAAADACVTSERGGEGERAERKADEDEQNKEE
ncbi:hypothetical protein ABB37_09013 [Leptomonas pyrrhocoris]|uniref:J domain-containing protein n=1 Tax=Leptomonas pyrrhocoris TaxID=157538 RepID=A0A0M9FRX1_LEPPY|nr:hypothetical protein ABB37_09013 [Leptomonas pyrrhocoris]XP_015653129.1 hypothetical protein ABB37_09013 [Leptomonas pyrrhocoris]KPA74689.1 hypothetical protein ABB37_09013 [Leptomonas pyrrhocoris]KPA74690.1 hypothetical protein ABB37_09013 [Leptomonas pyrrhocoris]|eukprot:XP_015653128.1 hypothetical protein ABB37_09013 [Leptomonas pyrrhocoris]